MILSTTDSDMSFLCHFFLVALQAHAAECHYTEPVHDIKKTVSLVHEFAGESVSVRMIFFNSSQNSALAGW